MRCIVPYWCLPLRVSTCKGTLNVAKVQYKLRVASGMNFCCCGNMERNMEENFSMEWKIFVGMEMEENCRYGIWKNRLPFHSVPCRDNYSSTEKNISTKNLRANWVSCSSHSNWFDFIISCFRATKIDPFRPCSIGKVFRYVWRSVWSPFVI